MARTAPERPQRDPQRTRAEILEHATAEFAKAGFSGARVDEIAARTRTTKRMIYYYFGGKAGLYTAVLEGAYAQIRAAEQELALDDLEPEEAMAELVRFELDYHAAHPELCRLVAVENIHHGEFLRSSDRLRGLNSPVIKLTENLLARGREAGVWHREVTAMEVHVTMMAQAMYANNHRYSINAIFGYDMGDPAIRTRLQQIAVDSLLNWLRSSD